MRTMLHHYGKDAYEYVLELLLEYNYIDDAMIEETCKHILKEEKLD